MRPRRFLLVSTALSSATLMLACKKESVPEPVHGNPKGSFYDAGQAEPPPPPPPATPDASTRVIPPPANPKGSHYDAGLKK